MEKRDEGRGEMSGGSREWVKKKGKGRWNMVANRLDGKHTGETIQ